MAEKGSERTADLNTPARPSAAWHKAHSSTCALTFFVPLNVLNEVNAAAQHGA
jgi:hypothetical protein